MDSKLLKQIIAVKAHIFFSLVCSVKKPVYFPSLFLHLSCLLKKIKIDIFSDTEYSRLKDATSLRHTRANVHRKELASVEVIILSSGNDLELIPHSIKYATDSLKVFENVNFVVIVPNIYKIAAKELTRKNPSVNVISENTLISETLFAQLRDLFGSRHTWVLQQIVKLKYTYSSDSDFILLLDVDTMLLNSRKWIDTENRQILMPSYEFNSDYYKFLHKLGIAGHDPKYSFVSHHLLISKIEFLEMITHLGFEDIDELIAFTIANVESKSQSPFSIDYELYSQYLFRFRRERLFLEKWSNIGIPRRFANACLNSKLAIRVLKYFFNSVSFHSWS